MEVPVCSIGLLSLVVLISVFNIGRTLETVSLSWNNQTDGLQYYHNVCAQNCSGKANTIYVNLEGVIVETSDNCFDCSCSPSCEIYGTCCPTYAKKWAKDIFRTVDSLYRQNRSVDEEVNNSTLDMGFERFDCIDIDADTKYYVEHYLVMRSCLETETNKTLHQLCTTKVPDTVMTYIPVSNRHTGVTYRNIYCLQCNEKNINVSLITDGEYVRQEEEFNTTKQSRSSEVSDDAKSFALWNLNVSCRHYQTLYQIRSKDEFLNRARNETILCKVRVKPPATKVKPETCSAFWYSWNEPIDFKSCKNPDPRLLWYCLNIRHPAFRTFDGQSLFCRLCQGKLPIDTFLTSNETGVLPLFPSPFSPISLLLGISKRTSLISKDLPNCSDTTWRNEKGECQPAMCSAGKELSPGGCRSVVEQIRGLGYKLFMELTPIDTVPWCAKCTEWIIRKVHSKFSKLSLNFKLETIIRCKDHSYTSADNKNKLPFLRKISLFARIVANDTLKRDDFESQFLKLVRRKWIIELPHLVNVTLRREFLGTGFRNRLEPVRLPRSSSAHSRKSGAAFKSLRKRYDNFSSWDRTSNTILEGLLEEKHVTYHNITDTTFSHPVWKYKNEFIDITHSLECPFVVVNTTVERFNKTTASFSFMYDGRTINVSATSNVSLVNGELHICVDIFKKLIRQTKHPEADAITIAQYYFEIVCVSLPVACLLMTFITYCLFQQLRTLPGLNNMSLCMTLAVAQTCLLITVQHGVKGDFHPIYCTIHAICLHYSWLAAFMWMGVCCVHMFRVFTARDRHLTEPGLYNKRHSRYCVCSYLTPVAIVLLTIAINMGVTNGTSSGYDNEICFIDTRRSILTIVLTLLIPLCLMIIVNGILFIVTVRTMWNDANSEHLDHSTRDKFSVLTYVKLSTLTGVFCIVAVVAVQIQNPILNFITSPLMALQGVFIFFSFMVNKRVGQMYSELSCCQRLNLWWQSRSTDRSRDAKAQGKNTADTLI